MCHPRHQIKRLLCCTCRELPVLTAADAGNARFFNDGLASLSLSPDEHVLAVTPALGNVVDLYMLHSIAEPGRGAQSFATWQLPAGEQAMQVREARADTQWRCSASSPHNCAYNLDNKQHAVRPTTV